jgi:hypothetical protein
MTELTNLDGSSRAFIANGTPLHDRDFHAHHRQPQQDLRQCNGLKACWAVTVR